MLFVVRFFPEIIIKTRPVRKRFIKILRRNVRALVTRIDENADVRGDWDIMEVETSSDDPAINGRVFDCLLSTPGIDTVMEADSSTLVDFDDMLQRAIAIHCDALRGRTFAVRCKRQGHHDFNSVDVERHVGAGLIRECEPAGVSLKEPDVEVRLEIRRNTLYMVRRHARGLGGYPLGTQEPVLSLISGGFDSAVATFQCIRRGLMTHYLFFNLGGREHELAVKEVAVYLWMRYGASQRVRFITVPFEGVVEEILTQVDNSHMGVVLKRMMMRAADQVAESMDIDALVTGESIAQVSSQTLPNLALIDSVTDRLVLRPLATTNKQEIIDQARRIGTEEFSRNVPEYCGVISVKPTTKARRHRVEAEESRMDMAVLDRAVANAEIQRIDRVVETLDEQTAQPDEFSDVPPEAVVLDIRHPDEQDLQPLIVNGTTELHSLPFYQLRTRFAGLDQDRQYLLYCDKGIMSRLQASHLRDAGYTNVAVYRPV
ncbi:MAG: tRNA uracil 4-sulfurtransferase ThiI [Pseudohongiellaceae bacterium]